MFDGRLVFVLAQQAGELKPQGKGATPQACAFASGESRDAAREHQVLQLAAKAADWDSFVFKLRIEGYELHSGKSFRAPFGKL